MRRLIAVLIVVIPLLAWGGCSVVAKRAANEAATAPWPLQLGSLRDVPARYPKRNASAAALELGPLEARLGIRLDRADKRPVTNEERAFSLVKQPLGEWVSQQIASGRDVVTPPPSEVALFLLDHRADIAAIRDHVLANDDLIEWPVDLSRIMAAPTPNALAHMAVTRCLVASALLRGDRESLHAAWMLTRIMWRRPDVISALVALATTRIIAGAACRMATPAPSWFGEVEHYDYVRAMAAAQQSDAWQIFALATEADFGATKRSELFLARVGRPLLRLSAADVAERERAIVAHFTPLRECAIDGPAFDKRALAALPRYAIHARIALPEWGGMWQRVGRLRAELELTQRILILKSRGWPATAPDLTTSQCADGTWSYANGDLRFSREVPVKIGGFPLRFSASPKRQ